MKDLFLATALLLSTAAFGQKTAAAAKQTEFIVKDAQSGQPLKQVEVAMRNKRVGYTDDAGIIRLSVQKGDTVLFLPHAILVEVKGGFKSKEFKKTTFIVPEKSYLTRQEVLVKDLYNLEDMQETYDAVAPPPPVAEPVNENEPASVVEQQAEFPGGMQAMLAYMSKNLVYPPSAIDKEIQGKCFIRFIVHKDGTISDIKIMRGVPGCPECDAEAIRFVKSMPKWTPGKIKGVAVNSYYNLPIHFALQ